MDKKTPVLLLTGYLGSGKTTLLNRILQNRQGIRFAVIVNDIGAVNIDAHLIQQGGVVDMADDSLVALQNGCICCTLQSDLLQQLHDIMATQRFDYIVIEASGICEPAPIAQSICTMPTAAPLLATAGIPVLDCIVTVVDDLRLRDEFQGGLNLLDRNLEEEDIENLVIQQIEFCNLILLNKADEVSAQELERTKEVIRAIQPKAEIIPCNYGDVPLERLLNTGLFDFERTATSATWVDKVENHINPEEEDADHGHHHEEEHCPHCHGEGHSHKEGHHHHQGAEGQCHCHHHHHHHHHEGGEAEEYGIGTYVYQRRQPFKLSLFDQFLARRWPEGIIRAKGLCYFYDEEDKCYLFEQAGKQVSLKSAGLWYATMPKRDLEVFLQRNPNLRQEWDEEYGDRMQKLVFIGRNLDKKFIAEELDKCLYTKP